MDTERILTDGLRRAAEHAPVWDDSLLPTPARQVRGRPPRWGWLAAAASVVVVVGALWLAVRHPPQTATPAAPPPSTATPTATAMTPEARPIDPPALSPNGTRPLVGTTWVAESLAGRMLVDRPLAERPWVRFEAEGTLVGHDGCNPLHGTYRADAERIEVAHLSAGSNECWEFPGTGFGAALQGATAFQLVPSGLLLSHADLSTPLTMHALTPTGDAALARPMLRVLNNTGQPITTVTLTAPGLDVEQGPLAAGASSEYLAIEGDLLRYARVTARFSDGGEAALLPADYVGEIPLAPGWYTYVLSVVPLHGPEGAKESALVLGLEEEGRPAGRP